MSGSQPDNSDGAVSHSSPLPSCQTPRSTIPSAGTRYGREARVTVQPLSTPGRRPRPTQIPDTGTSWFPDPGGTVSSAPEIRSESFSITQPITFGTSPPGWFPFGRTAVDSDEGYRLDLRGCLRAWNMNSAYDVWCAADYSHRRSVNDPHPLASPRLPDPLALFLPCPAGPAPRPGVLGMIDAKEFERDPSPDNCSWDPSAAPDRRSDSWDLMNDLELRTTPRLEPVSP